MAALVNFLPWRNVRRRQRVRIGMLYAIGLVLALLTIAVAQRAARDAGEAPLAVRMAADNQLFAALSQRESLLLERQQQWEQRRQRQQRRALTEAWHQRLQTIAMRLPPQAWLTRLEYQRDALTLSGLALNLNAVAGLGQALSAVSGFRPARAGETRRGEQGYWQFSFSLAGEHADASHH